MAIIAKLVAILGLDAAAFDAGMNRARHSVRGFGDDTAKMGQSTSAGFTDFSMIMFRTASVIAAVHTGLKAVTAVSAASTGDLVKLGEVIKSLPFAEQVSGIVAMLSGIETLDETMARLKGIDPRTVASTKAFTLLGDTLEEIAAADFSPLQNEFAKIDKWARTSTAILKEGAKAREGFIGADELGALAKAASLRKGKAREADEKAKQEAAGKKAAPGESLVRETELAYWKVALSAEEFRKIELQILGYEPELLDWIVKREAETKKLTEIQQAALAAVGADLPDYDAVIASLDEVIADHEALASAAESLAASLRSPWQILQDEVDKYTLMLESGLLTQEEFNQAVMKAGKVAAEGLGGVSPHRGQAAIYTSERQYAPLPGATGDALPLLLKQIITKEAEGNRHLQKLVDSGGLG